MQIPLTPSTELSHAETVRLPRAASAVFSLPTGGNLSVSLCRPEQRLPDLALAPGGSVLLAAGDSALVVAGDGLISTPVPAWAPRMLAFHDQINGCQRSVRDPVLLPGQLPLPGPLDDTPRSRAWLISHLANGTPAFAGVANRWARGEIYQIVRFVLAHTHLSVQQLASRYGLSPAQFRRVTVKAFGRPLKEQLRLLRASRALQMHAETGASFTRVAGELGFSSPSHFCHDIKSLLGESPRAIFQPTRSP